MERLEELIGKAMGRSGYATRLVRENIPLNLEEAVGIFTAIGTNLCGHEYVIDRFNRFAIENTLKWLHCDESMLCNMPEGKEQTKGDITKGLYYAGPTGTGKSLLTEIINVYSTICDIGYRYGNDTAKLTFLHERSDAIVDSYVSDGTLKKYKDSRLLCIQDLGSEATEALYMGTRVNVLRTILEARGDMRNIITIVTSNLPMQNKRIVERYGERVQSRLHSMFNYFAIGGSDYRTK